VNRVGQREAGGLQPPEADAGEAVGELPVAAVGHDHLDSREPGAVHPAELGSLHLAEQRGELTLGRAPILHREPPDDMARRRREDRRGRQGSSTGHLGDARPR